MTDVPVLEALIRDSVQGLSAPFYTARQAESALRHVFGVDTQLILDQTYYVVELHGAAVAAGGWSARRTLYGGDQRKEDVDPMLDPSRDAARIRAFFVHPGQARRGLGRMLFERCRDAADAAGFGALELMATLPGVPLYRALGFVEQEHLAVPLPDGETLPCVRMARPLP
jgi:GNAT superfamily N-acetyltransferase